MKTINFSWIIALFIITTICSCQSELDNTIQNVSTIQTETNAVKKYVDENTFIDLDVTALAKEIASPDTRTAVDLDKVAQMKAAIYRFYSHVELEEGVYVCHLSAASDINVSESVYQALLENLNAMNSSIQKAKEAGQEINLPEVNEAYLNSLLE